MIHSLAFESLPAPLKRRIYQRLGQVLSGSDSSRPFRHLGVEERRAIREILLDTQPEAARFWKS